jgi:hypothetical protein
MIFEIANGAAHTFSVLFPKLTLFCSLFFYLSICEQVPGNVFLILTVPNAAFGVKTLQ